MSQPESVMTERDVETINTVYDLLRDAQTRLYEARLELNDIRGLESWKEEIEEMQEAVDTYTASMAVCFEGVL